ncbi:MAG: hypothetical protein J6Y94_02040 [Bacteriovoracaceae bacterium]|nr:hypothetical protein [Bacteriovoracaceae bacterium]
MNFKSMQHNLGPGLSSMASKLIIGAMFSLLIVVPGGVVSAAENKMTADQLVNLSQELVKREEQIKLRELALQQKSDELESNIKNFEGRLKEFEEQQSKILGCLAEQDAQKNKRLDQLVTSIAAMRPQNAAEVLSVQDADIAVRILDRLDPAQSAKIFNLMDKESSAGLQKQYLNMKK